MWLPYSMFAEGNGIFAGFQVYYIIPRHGPIVNAYF